MWTVVLNMTAMFLNIVGCIAASADIRRSSPALPTIKMTQVVCNDVVLTTRADENCFFDVLDMISDNVCHCAAYADVRTEKFAFMIRTLDVPQVVVMTIAAATRTCVLEVQVLALQVSPQVLVGNERFSAAGLKARPTWDWVVFFFDML